MMKRNVEYMGLDCAADKMDPMYMHYKMLSQKQIPWASQTKYAKYTVYFGVAVIFVALVKHSYYRVRDIRFRSGSTTNAAVSLIDVLISYCRFVGYKQTPRYLQYFASFPKSVGSALFMMLTTLYLACYCFVPHFWYRPCIGFGSPPLAIRAGLMATALMPFIYVLSGKSNMITLLTGVSYEKLNTYHQYVGVAAFILSIVHTVPFIYQFLQESGAAYMHDRFMSKQIYISAIPSFILLGLLCTLSKAWFRKHCYEMFLHLHWMMGVAFFGCLMWHTKAVLGSWDYMWGALAFWSTQLIFRILVKTCFRPNSMFLRSRRAHLTKLDENTYEINVDNVKGYTWRPGQHVFLRFKGLRILDSHPFSIGSTSEQGEGMKFIVVPQKGLTKVHFEELDHQIELNKQVYIDGPYGGTFRDVTKFEKVVLVASGSGVTATIPFLSYLSQLHQQKSPLADNLKCINFIWVVRKENNIAWFSDELTKCQEILGKKLHLDIRVCHQQNQVDEVRDDKFDLEKSAESDDQVSFPTFPITYGKPQITNILHSLRTSLSRRNIVVCSGSPSMLGQVSETVSEFQSLIFNNDLRNTNVEEVYLHTESFSW
ncbi:hypothetical protein CORT_0H00660 [Candida orthopsilosis Co 90-125]|uniref:ferric-chelate reductase (NADPH) n=1 Tax=Candida orthopsilosis (strain 90-125) TaxID=1136231 RepID=H8XBJ5_CANO9|nr:hypothetical protein CORT_0H00660 [Candida orthopsilosis Co 90-125]CCG25183.1 hypothetical protein CORT_0H00660 [Candida orthopsilosis Co 90-125]